MVLLKKVTSTLLLQQSTTSTTSSSSSSSWTLFILLHISFFLMTMAKFANNTESQLLYYNSNSNNFIRCSFNPLCYCKYDERTEIFETIVRLWFMVKFNSSEYEVGLTKLINTMNDDPIKVYHVSSTQILQLANTLTNSSGGGGMKNPANKNIQSLRLSSLFEYGPVFDIDCDKVPITQIPTEYNVQGLISHVSVAGSKLLILDGSAFAGLEIQGIRLTNNQLYFVSEYAFSSMANTLTMLDLSSNLLDEIPFSAFKTLKVLEWLNLSNNLINSIFGDWFHVAESMRKLILAENSIESLTPRLLAKFHRLAWLDLSSNTIMNITNENLPPNVQNLNLMKNRVSQFPKELFKLRSLSWLYLSGCDLEKIPNYWQEDVQPLQMNQLDISDNFVQAWPTKPFDGKLIVLDLSINQNYIEIIPSHAFFSMNVFRLSLGHNRIREISPSAFLSLEPTLKYLNLENNKLEVVPWDALRNLSSLVHLYMGSNFIHNHGVGLPEGMECKLTYLGLNANQLGLIPKRILTHCSHLFHLNLGYNQITQLDDFAHFSLRGKRFHNLHTLILRSNPIRSIAFSSKAPHHLELTLPYLGAQRNQSNPPTPSVISMADLDSDSSSSAEDFRMSSASTLHTSELKSIPNIFTTELFPNLHELSLSFCELFGELEPFPLLPLTTLEISMGLKTTTSLTPSMLSSLRQLEWLALDHNNLQSISAYTFYSNRKLNYVNLEWNRIESLPPQLFHPDIHHSIAQLRLSHNKITSIQPQSFISFSAINLDLSYNLISNIDKEALTSFTPSSTTGTTSSTTSHHHHQYGNPDSQQLRGTLTDSTGRKSSSPSLGGTQQEFPTTEDPIGSILQEYDSIGGLHLYLSHNQLTQMKTHVFTSSKFSLIDLSHNQLSWFTFDTIGPSTIVGTLNLSSNSIEHILFSNAATSRHWLKSFDLSHNKLKTINLSPLCVTNQLDLSFNRLEIINQTYFPFNCSVKELSLSSNVITSLDPGSFANLRDLTVLYLDRNQLTLFPPVALIRNTKLRYVDLSHNRLRSLPRDCLVGSAVESLSLSWNRFVNIPVSALSQISRFLKRLDMSYNSIEHLDSTMFESVSTLMHLNLSSNRLNSLPDSTFANLASLRELDLSHNQLRANFKELFHFLPKLKVLRLSNCGIKVFPFLPLRHLISLDLSSNGLHDIKVQSLGSLIRLRELDLSNNKLINAKLPPWTSLYNLKYLKLSRNPLKSLTHDTLFGLTKLEKLDLMGMGNLERFDSDVFSNLHSLRSLSVETYPNIEKYRFRLGAVLSSLIHLEELNVVIKESALSDQLNGGILPKLHKLRISGENLKRIESNAFEGLQNCFQMDLSITHTSINEIPQRLFTLLQYSVWAKLDLSFNKLSSLDFTTLYSNKTLWYTKGTKLLEGGLALNGNEFICDCDLVWLGEWTRRWLRESFQSHSIENIQLLHSTYEQIARAKCIDNAKGVLIPIVELYSDTMCHASALSSSVTSIHHHKVISDSFVLSLLLIFSMRFSL